MITIQLVSSLDIPILRCIILVKTQFWHKKKKKKRTCTYILRLNSQHVCVLFQIFLCLKINCNLMLTVLIVGYNNCSQTIATNIYRQLHYFWYFRIHKTVTDIVSKHTCSVTSAVKPPGLSRPGIARHS